MGLNKKVIAAMGIVMSMCAGGAHADGSAPDTITVPGGTIHFKGSLVDAPCSVSTDSSDQIVNLGQYTLAHFAKAGDKGSTVPFNIKLEDCVVTTYSTAAVAFQGRVNEKVDTLLAIDSGDTDANSATASGVGIQILDTDNKPLSPDGASFSAARSLITGENVLNFAAQYVADGNAVAAGQANADATFIMQYN